MSKFSDNFEETYRDTGKISRETISFKKHKPKEFESIQKQLRRFKK